MAAQPEPQPALTALLRVVDVLDNVFARLDEFRQLEPGWDSYDAEPISATAIKTARGLLMLSAGRLGTDGRAQPSLHVAPLADGGVQIEWHTPSRSLEVDAQADGSLGYLLLTRTESGNQYHESDHANLDEVLKALEAVTGSTHFNVTS